MKKITFVGILVIAISALFISPVCAKEKTVKWRMAYFLPSGNPHTVNSLNHFCDIVNNLGEGQIKIAPHGAGEIVGGMEILDAVSNGMVDLGSWTPMYDIGRNPVGAILGCLPFGFSTHEYVVWYYQGGGKELCQEFYDGYNIHVIGAWFSPGEIAGHTRKQINSLDDMKGMVLREAGLQARILESMGYKTAMIPHSEIYTAMERGIIDLVELGSPSLNLAFGLHEVGKYIMLPSWHQPSVLILNIVNKDAWDNLPDNLKLLLEVATDSEYRNYGAYSMHEDALAIKKMQDYGCTFTRLPDSDLKKLYEARQKILKEYADKDPFFAKVLKSQEEFLAEMRQYKKLYDYDFEH
ncbi:MAG: TRAP transporter substrate-binding protein DctP [Syntrophaceae bacterium]|nr:TRAP transporter substrate-binding protein DctP [Syntrophaceae bacterium]